MGNATNETTKKTNWLDAIKAQFKRIIWPTKEEGPLLSLLFPYCLE